MLKSRAEVRVSADPEEYPKRHGSRYGADAQESPGCAARERSRPLHSRHRARSCRSYRSAQHSARIAVPGSGRTRRCSGVIGARASSSKRHLGLCYRGGEILSLRAAKRHRRQRGTPRTRSGRRPQPLSGSPALDELTRQETECGIARDQASPRHGACVRLGCEAAEWARAAGKRRLGDFPRCQRPQPPSCGRRCRRPCESRRRPPTWRGLAFSPSRPNWPSVAFGAAAAGQGQVRRRGRR
jgi:hypothetical protein